MAKSNDNVCAICGSKCNNTVCYVKPKLFVDTKKRYGLCTNCAKKFEILFGNQSIRQEEFALVKSIIIKLKGK